MYLGGVILFIIMLMTILCCVEYIMVKKEFDKIEFEIERISDSALHCLNKKEFDIIIID